MSKNTTAIMVRFDTVEQKEAFEKLASRYGMTASQALKSIAYKAIHEQRLDLNQDEGRQLVPTSCYGMVPPESFVREECIRLLGELGLLKLVADYKNSDKSENKR